MTLQNISRSRFLGVSPAACCELRTQPDAALAFYPRSKFALVYCRVFISGSQVRALVRPPRSLTELEIFPPSPDGPFVPGFAGPVSGPYGLCGRMLSLAAISVALSPYPKIPFLAQKGSELSYLRIIFFRTLGFSSRGFASGGLAASRASRSARSRNIFACAAASCAR
jgi:hypothetical protein